TGASGPHPASILGARMTARHMPLTARSDFAVLAALEEYGALSQADLGRRLGLDRNEVSGIVTRLASGRHVASAATGRSRLSCPPSALHGEMTRSARTKDILSGSRSAWSAAPHIRCVITIPRALPLKYRRRY